MGKTNKRILIWMTSMHLGGAERALVGLLYAIDYDKYDVDLFLNRHEGELLIDIPNKVNILPSERHYESLAESLAFTIRKGHFLIAICRLFAKVYSFFKTKGPSNNGGISIDYSHRFTKWLMPKIQKETEYDLAISFITPHYFVAEKVKAKKKISWIHTDYSQISLDNKSQIRMWSPYDSIIAVSDGVAQSFRKVFPCFSDKILVIENILPTELIKRQAREPALDYDNKQKTSICILSVGRFSYPKNFDSIPAICRKIINNGLSVKWYIIGYGGEEKRIKENINLYGMEDNVIILGKKANPYPYIANCDLYVQPSRYEGKAVTVREAQFLTKPVVITDFPTSESQLENGVDGIIVPLNIEECADSITSLLNSPERMEALINACKCRDYSNSNEVIKLYELMENS